MLQIGDKVKPTWADWNDYPYTVVNVEDSYVDVEYCIPKFTTYPLLGKDDKKIKKMYLRKEFGKIRRLRFPINELTWIGK